MFYLTQSTQGKEKMKHEMYTKREFRRVRKEAVGKCITRRSVLARCQELRQLTSL